MARFLDRVSRLSPDELDRLAAAEPPPIAFLATVRRFVTADAAAAFEAAEAELAARVPRDRWVEVGLREGLLGVAAELVLSAFFDDTLAEPFRGRARDRLLRAWEASIDQPRYGPNGAEVLATVRRTALMTPPEVALLIRASAGVPGDDRPWPPALDLDDDEALRISAVLAARDVASALRVDALAPATAARAQRLLARIGPRRRPAACVRAGDLRPDPRAVRDRDRDGGAETRGGDARRPPRPLTIRVGRGPAVGSAP